MPEITIDAGDFDFDGYGRVVFSNKNKGVELSEILKSADSSNTNGGCQNNGCGNNVSCDEAFLKQNDVSLPGKDGTEELIISNADFSGMMKKIKQGVISNKIFIKASD